MNDSPSPTPYAEINAVLHDFAVRTRSILGSQFLGLYLVGSLALGDFDPEASDLDWIVVTRTKIPADSSAALAEMHAQFERSDSPWVGKVEAAYVPRVALNHPAPTSDLHPQVEKGTRLFLAPLEIAWVFQRYILREHGVIIAGPDPRTLIDPVDPADMRRAAEVIVGGWLEQSRHDPPWVAWARQRSNQAFVVLTLCRILYSLETGSVASKPAAARWAQKTLDQPWESLIECSLAGQHDVQGATDSDLQGALAFLGDIHQRILGTESQ